MVATMIAAGASWLAGATGMSIAYATFAVNFALSMVVSRIFSDNPETQQDMGVRQQVPPSAVNAIPVVYGAAYMGGTFVDAVLTTDQKTMYYVLAISSISPNGTFTFDTADMYYGDRKITFDGSDLTKVVSLTDEAGNVDTKVSGNLYINLYTSTTGGTITSANGASAPSTVMGGSDISVGQRWTGTRQMNGLGFAIVKLIYNRDADTTQLSPITFKVAHTLNGTGVAKAGDVWYDYMTNAVYGGAVDAAFVNSTSATALNAYGDQNITFTNSSGNPATQARYRINGVLDAGQSVLSNVDRIVSACDSWMTYNAALGQWSVVINKAESTSYAFNDNNIIGEIRVSATDITSSINQVEARFPFKDNRDQAAFVNIETPSGLLYPNEPVNKYSITYDMVNDSVQAHYLANRLLEQAREDLIVGFSTTYYGIQVDAGDVVSVTNSDYGWNAKLFRVMKVNEASLPDGSLGARLEMSEYNAQVYDDQPITQFSPIPNSGLPSVSYFSPLAAPTVTGFATATIPYINVQVLVPTTGRVTFGNLFWTTTATPTAADWKLVTSAASANGQPVQNGAYYTFSNITLNTGTYYFAYNVGNDVTTSILSPISAALVWNPVAASGPFVDISGFTGFSKNAAGTVITPASSVLTAVVQNVTSPTYAWAITGATPTTGSASTITITPSLAASSVTASLTVNGSNLTTPIVRTITMPITLDGSGGTAGLNSATVYLYNKNTTTTPPALFSGTFTYTFTSGVLSGGTLNGWSQTPPAIAAGEFLFLSLATASSTSATDSIPTAEFSTPQVISGTGTNGANTAIVSLFNSNTSAVTPPTSPSGTFTYTFATAVLSGGTLNGWSQTQPNITAGQYVWQKQATAFSSAATDTITAGEFSGAVVVGGVGTNGSAGNSFRIAYYTQSQSLSAPSVSPNPTTGSTSFPTSVAWAGTITTPAAGQSLWAIDGTYVPTTNQTTWSTPYLTQGFPTTIQSDNYVLNTSGWQIQRNTGDAFFNNGTFRGNVVAGNVLSATATLGTTSGANYWLRGSDGAAYFGGETTVSGKFTVNGSFAQAGIGNISAAVTGNAGGASLYVTNSSTGASVYSNNTGSGTAGIFYGNTTGAFGLPTVYAINTGTGLGLRADSVGTAAQFISSSGGYAIIASSSLSPCVFFQGDLGLGYSNSRGSVWTLLAPSTTVAAAASYYLNSNGTWQTTASIVPSLSSDSNSLGGFVAASWARIFVGDTGTANAAGSGMNFNCTVSGVQFSGASNTLTLQPVSDRRLKENIQPETLGLNFIKALIPVTYNMIGQTRKAHGFIHDQVQPLISGHNDSLSMINQDGMGGVDYMSLIAPLVNSIQELSAQIEELKKQIPKI
jgi:hypothetical protein